MCCPVMISDVCFHVFVYTVRPLGFLYTARGFCSFENCSIKGIPFLLLLNGHFKRLFWSVNPVTKTHAGIKVLGSPVCVHM